MPCRHTEGPLHDCEYVNARNELIPDAVFLADEEVGADADAEEWGVAFLKAMDRLWRARALSGSERVMAARYVPERRA